jgi:diguanylate cyclase (GGDEF)-like protein
MTRCSPPNRKIPLTARYRCVNERSRATLDEFSVAACGSAVDMERSMIPPLRERLALTASSDQPAAAVAEARPDAGLMARSLMYLFAFGGSATLLSLLVSGPDGNAGRMAVTAACSYGIALLLLSGYDRMPSWTFDVLLACGTVLIEWTVWASSDSTSSYAMLYFWIAIWACYFLPQWRAVLQLGIVALAYGAVIALADDRSNTAVVHWAVTNGALIVAGALIGVQRAHTRRVVSRLADDARRDTLTGLLNRRGFEELFATELERARRTDGQLSVIVADLDRFKRLNDRFGHQAGDQALQRVAEILRTAKRRIDTAARIGGEEFAVIVPSSDHHAAYILAERMRREVRETFASDASALTVSLGVAAFSVHGASADALVRNADQALYAAKKLGRDRTVVYSDDIAGTLLMVDGGPADGDPSLHRSTVLALAEVIDGREHGSTEHSQRVGRYAAAIAEALGLPDDVIELVRFGGIVHDIGKIGVPDKILRKPGWLTDDEWDEVQRHPEIAARILRGANFEDVSGWVHAHHERPDGSGYPRGLAGGEIPLEARILAVADAYEAMRSHRVYRPALTPPAARAELKRCAGTQFDERVVATFIGLLDGGLAEDRDEQRSLPASPDGATRVR